MEPAKLPAAAADEAQELLRRLLRIDTTNPPGHERAAAELCAEVLRADGLEPVLLEKAPGRTNLVCRRKGKGGKAPLLLTAHLDVVPAGEGWTHPPFGGVEADGFLWGRGAIDMKNHAAAAVTILRHLEREGIALDRDVIVALVADEETGCEYGSDFLVAQHPELVRAEWALGEIGGFTLHLEGKRFYPIQVAQKGALWLKATARGEMGHGSMPRDSSAVGTLTAALAKLAAQRLPLHPPAATRAFLEAVGRELPLHKRLAFGLLLSPTLGPKLLAKLPDRALARTLGAVLANTATPTVLRAGEKTNVIPAVAEAEIDGRTLPGPDGAKLLEELRAIVGDELELTPIRTLPALEAPIDSELFALLAATIRRHDPAGIPVPYMIPGFTDGFAFAKLGAKFYGFAPVQLPSDPPLKFAELYHNVDERIPIAGFRWGVGVLWDAVTTFCR